MAKNTYFCKLATNNFLLIFIKNKNFFFIYYCIKNDTKNDTKYILYK